MSAMNCRPPRPFIHLLTGDVTYVAAVAAAADTDAGGASKLDCSCLVTTLVQDVG